MRINKVAFGNTEEAFIEEHLSHGVNIIYSDDNNKGKTLLIQGMMYAIGNDPIFPSGFNYNNYYFYVNISFENIEFEFLRKKNTVMVRSKDFLQICDSISELKYFIHKNIFQLFKIPKKEESKLVDLSLFYQIFFIGQDKRNPSNVINQGYNNKQDFLNLLSSINGYPIIVSKNENAGDNKGEITKAREEIKAIKKIMTFVKDNPYLADFTTKSSDRERFMQQGKQIKEINANISNYKRKRSSELNRKEQLENLIGELNSLNYNIEKGKVVCSKCGSNNITYTNGDISFDVSNIIVRRDILKSIEESINMKKDIISEYSESINFEQDKLAIILRNMPVEVKKILLYSEEILSNEEYDAKIIELEDKIISNKKDKDKIIKQSETSREKYEKMKINIISKMNYNYQEVDPFGNLVFRDLFTKKDETYSGSEEQEFYYCKIIAINDYFKHEFPIIIDAFRDGELSSKKEKVMIEHYKRLGKQVILTATLKEEEYEQLKYEEMNDVTAIDYSIHDDSKILQKKYTSEFIKILNTFNILI